MLLKRTILTVSILLLLATSIAGAAPRFVSKQGFSLIPPPGWRTVESKTIPVVFFGPTENSFRTNINVTGPHPIGKTHANPIKEVQTYFARILKEYKPLSAVKIPNGRYEIYDMVHVFRMETGLLKQKQRIVIRGDKFYTITYSVHPNNYSKHLRAFDACASSFEMK